MRERSDAGSKNDAVEALRGSAALTVFVYHCIQQWPGFPRGPFLVFHKGLVGVDVFLVISGFVTTASWLALRDQGHPTPDREYWQRRLARIFPLFWLTSAVYLVAVSADALRGPDAWFQGLTHLTLTHGFFPSAYGTINAVTWTLTLEACLYVLGWLALRFVNLDRFLWPTTVFVLALGFAYRWWVFQAFGPVMRLHCSQLVFGMADGFWFGLVAAYAMHRGRFSPRAIPKTVRVAIAIAALAALHGLVAIMDALGDAYWSSPWCVVAFRTGLAVVSFALLVVCLGAAGLPRLLRPLAAAGTISYGIYLWHLPVLLVLLRWDTAPWVRAVVALLATLLLSVASHRWFELPIMRRVKRR